MNFISQYFPPILIKFLVNDECRAEMVFDGGYILRVFSVKTSQIKMKHHALFQILIGVATQRTVVSTISASHHGDITSV